MEYTCLLYTSAMIVTLITVGKMLESYSKGKTTNALKGLMDLAPKTATIIKTDENGNEYVENVSIDQVEKGCIFVVRPGESIPVDGIVIEGESAVDESAITGESIPVDKTSGSEVTSATINRSGFLKCRAKRVGEDTTPVSYTHLDVYKRQLFNKLVCVGLGIQYAVQIIVTVGGAIKMIH